MSTNPRLPKVQLDPTRKLRLNAEQWQALQALANDGGNTSAIGLATGIGRLTSHGLVAMDQSGCAYLTIFGLQRLNQGR